MSIMHRSFLTIALVGLTVVARGASAAEPIAVTVEHGVEVKMRDGTILRADIYRPKTRAAFRFSWSALPTIRTTHPVSV
ncbi:MAG TPA: hypothetical protein VKQ11_19270 [Candidatus Sulfotelmatobacter sp.]|nr:hypothetical protein [Candidatus Sulfotelmatobacter sp.]